MNSNHTVYIGIGSNQGDRLKNLQEAVDQIFLKMGKVSIISEVYNTPALEFEGEDFLNACLLLETALSPKEVLTKLQDIENKLGRERSKVKGYQSRPIDLDILFYDEMVINEENLVVPHPRMHQRQFVLQPLSKIAPNFKHPNLKLSVSELLKNCTDNSNIEPIRIWLKNPVKEFDFGEFNYLAIEGNIGAGKTSLAQLISNDFNAKLILERFADNPFLPKFYEDPQRYAFTLEMSFLADRYQQISDDLAQLDLFKDFVVSDYDVFKSLIFSKITLHEDEFDLYRKLFHQMYKDIAKPDLYVYLYQNTERLQENIKKRGRDYEQNIESGYLEKINQGYLAFLKDNPNLNVKIIDVSDKDFVESREDYLWVLEEILSGK